MLTTSTITRQAGAMRLRPDIRLTDAINSLEELVRQFDTALANVRDPDSHERYLKLVDQAERALRTVFTDGELADALHSERYWHIRRYWENRPTAYLGPADEQKWMQRDSQSVYQIESELRGQLERVRTALAHLKLFSPLVYPSRSLLVLDTNVFVHFDPFRDEIDQAKWCEIARKPKGAEFRLVVPVVVLDELDRRAHSGDRNVNRRGRAALSHLDPFVDDLLTSEPKAIRAGADWMTVEVLPDAPSHHRQADNDLELLDRAEFLYQVTGQQVRLVTADRGMRVRGTILDKLRARGVVRMVAMPEALRVQEKTAQSRRGGSSSPSRS
jgi:PIN domain